MKDRAARRTGIGALAASALVISLLALGGSQAANAADYASIRGTVTADVGGAPLTYPQVALYQKSGTTWKFYDSTSGGADGTYQFQNLPTGTYTLAFRPQHGDNFVSEWWNNQPTQASASSIAIVNTIGSVTHQVANAGLATGATISGHVTVPSATFTPDPDISLLKPDTSGGYNGWQYAGLWAYPAEDGSGDYTIVGIPPGTYSVFFGDDATASDFAPLYYSSTSTGTQNDWQASSITLATAEVKTGVNATYKHGATVTGKVTDYLGTGVSGVTATFWRKTSLVVGGVTQWEPWAATTGTTGTFKLAGLPTGTYGLEFTKSGYTTIEYAGGATFTLSAGVTKAFSAVKMYKTLTSSTPTITGTKKVGYKLTASHNTWTAGTTFSYAWYANGVYISGTSGPTHSTFVLTSAQRGKRITVKVTGKKAGYTTVTRTSAATVAIQ